MSSPSTDLELAYLLTDRHGEPYLETSVDLITLPSKTQVARFRDAVKTKNPNKLGSVDSSNLKVFKDKAAFEAGEKPLGPLSLLNQTFGTDEENALIVMVSPPAGMVSVCV
jgi:hypothetical protein